MSAATPRQVPVRFAFDEARSRPEGWGRLAELAPAGARLLTRFEIVRGERLWLFFELAGESLETPARALSVRTDDDGWKVAELRFEDALTRQRVGRAVRELLSRG